MRRLPLVTEQALAEARSKQSEISNRFHQRIDLEEVTCSKGCHHCCYHPVAISLLEGTLLYNGLKRKGLWTSALRNLCEEKAGLITGVPPESWMLAKIACPLLQDGLCLAYNSRPLVCRTTMSTGIPDLCDPHNFGLQTPLIPRLDELSEFQTFERILLKNFSIHYRTLPLALAVLLGERIATGQLTLESSEADVVARYMKAYSVF